RLPLLTQRHSLEELQGFRDGQLCQLSDVPLRDGDRQSFSLEPPSSAFGTWHRHHVGLELGTHSVRVGLCITTLDVAEHSLPWEVALLLPVVAVKDAIPYCLRQLAPRRIQIELVRTRERRKDHFAQVALRLAPWDYYALENGDAVIAENELLAHAPAGAEPTAGWTRTER